MVRYAVRRLLASVPMLFVLTIVVFAIISLAPGGPVAVVAGGSSGPPSAAQLEQLKQNLGLNDPVPVQYVRWLGHLVQGDLGKSYVTGEPVLALFARKLPATLILICAGVTLALVVSIPMGVLAARRPGSLADRFLMTAAIVGFSIPDFWLALLLLTFLASRLGLFPVGGMFSAGQEGSPLDLAWHLILPAIAIATPLIGGWSRYIRTSVVDVLEEDYITTARAAGLSPFRILLGHALKNGLLPLVTLLGLSVPLLFGGSAVIEYMFAWPGMGWQYLASAVNYHDYPVILGGLVMVSLLTVVGSLLADLGYAFIDPRIRDGA